ncbi:hypothetical protein FHS04_000002 [Mesoflavibacter sabulilitoris]|uniref:Uncharacterized protein n=1 Tax=Mesoflavibacter zeaxanthinifaciens subsp. sabulilitoris TaxID=1520893 RepID=A0A2T1NKV0_9FLAO|nr:hypothetical protein [Mesoflavibacter zeaxanthinifaciens]MBB3122514.1 hypothetical protein [Mesoflavibacter zeaxanthinifaciens subsp. sabulilitoris]PSG93525.1 hypothetical protein C7H61_03160 [Mesoflavibacter zeaxanthinifaciens subsp. sabulilitoris]
MNNRTIEITSRFEKSWNDTEKIFDMFLENGFERLIPVREFISELKKKGENQHFRIGTSLYPLIFSRSVEYGLRDDQKQLIIDTLDKNDYEIIFKDGFKKYRKYRISDLNDNRLTKLLKTLKGTLVD